MRCIHGVSRSARCWRCGRATGAAAQRNFDFQRGYRVIPVGLLSEETAPATLVVKVKHSCPTDRAEHREILAEP
jgi:hypothetical protein